MARLANKKALSTGGTRGIGLATAQLFLAEGARVAITGADTGRFVAVRSKLGPEVTVVAADAGSVDAQRLLANTVKTTFGKLDVLFVNAGLGDFRPIEQWDEAAFDRLVAVNLKGAFFLVQALLPIFSKGAAIVLNTSINARIGMPNSSVYAATKAGLISMARTLSGELVGRGIRVNAVSPGPIATPLYDKIGMGEPEIDALVGMIPLKRRGHPEEIANAVLFLASDESGFTGGSEIVIDGGMSNL